MFRFVGFNTFSRVVLVALMAFGGINAGFGSFQIFAVTRINDSVILPDLSWGDIDFTTVAVNPFLEPNEDDDTIEEDNFIEDNDIFYSLEKFETNGADEEDNNEYVAIVEGCRSVQIEELTIPEFVESDGQPYKVIKINDQAFDRCYSLKTINLPETLEFIGNFAFRNCTSLERIVIPESVESIAQMAFKDCSALKEVKLSNSLTVIGYMVFANCVNLESITIPNNMRYLRDKVFAHCSNLKSVIFQWNFEEVGELGTNLFEGCDNLREVKVLANSNYRAQQINIPSGCRIIEY